MKKKREKVTVKEIYDGIVRVQTGLDEIELGKVHGHEGAFSPAINEFSAMNAEEICKRFIAEAHDVYWNESTPEHIKALAALVESSSQIVRNSALQNIAANKICADDIGEVRYLLKEALLVGYYYCRMRLAENEDFAWSGKRISATAKKKGRAPQAGSVREVLDEKFPDWRNTPNLKLARALNALPGFKDKHLANLRRTIQAAKKVPPQNPGK